MAKISIKIIKNSTFFIDCQNIFWKRLRPPDPLRGDPPYKPSIGGPRSTPRKIPASANEKRC